MLLIILSSHSLPNQMWHFLCRSKCHGMKLSSKPVTSSLVWKLQSLDNNNNKNKKNPINSKLLNSLWMSEMSPEVRNFCKTANIWLQYNMHVSGFPRNQNMKNQTKQNKTFNAFFAFFKARKHRDYTDQFDSAGRRKRVPVNLSEKTGTVVQRHLTLSPSMPGGPTGPVGPR